MQNIVRVLNLVDGSIPKNDVIGLIDGEAESCLSSGDLLGAGEWLTSKLDYAHASDIGPLVAKTLALWASPTELVFSPSDIGDLIGNLDRFDHSALAAALGGLVARHPKPITHNQAFLNDVTFRLFDSVQRVFAVTAERPQQLSTRAGHRVESAMAEAVAAVELFCGAKCVSARTAALEVVKKCKGLRAFLLAREKPLISVLDLLLGGAFRELCQSYERRDDQKVILRLADVQQQAQDVLAAKAMPNSVLWQSVIKPVAEHVLAITEEVSRTSQLALTPSIKLATNLFKADLKSTEPSFSVSARLSNEGAGSAMRVKLDTSTSTVSVINPKGTFDLAGGSDRVITLECRLKSEEPSVSLPIVWQCSDISGRKHSFQETLRFEQQRKQPDWAVLLDRPPYTVNPVKTRDRLFGREAQLEKLLLYASAGTSTFVWGQKRVGKTSLLQVMHDELSKKARSTCVFLRMGQIAGMHEGQLAYTIASRLHTGCPASGVVIPSESDFGAGLGRLVPFVEGLLEVCRDWRLVVTIDEFDDLDPSFYTGERGRLFVKALRSLSEIGLTFVFAGSERMNVIYSKHALELNKWTNLFLDSITSVPDCRDLIVQPVKEQLEYQSSCVDAIADYCRGNPFFMHLVCLGLFERCVAERRTYISEADFHSSVELLKDTLGQTNFSHFWQDNPILDRDENAHFSAENCLVLCCLAAAGGTARNAESLWEQQDSLNLMSTERLSLREISMIVDRLRSRRVVGDIRGDGILRISVPMFADWLLKNGEVTLLPIWRKFSAERSTRTGTKPETIPSIVATAEPPFPIPEDDLLPISQNLVFCGKQKDVAELRAWLRQFDDDNRIEMAFLLLKRLSEKGYVSDGAREYSISKLVDILTSYRLEVGGGKWNIFRGRRDNLCVSYVDSELKSGAALARDVAKRVGPGKAAPADGISTWLSSRRSSDPILLLVDDFSGSGTTLRTGIKSWKAAIKDHKNLDWYLDNGRVLLIVLYALGSALDCVREVEPRLKIVATDTLGPEVLAFDPEAVIFETADEKDFAREVMLQIGRELTPQMPLGFQDQGALIAFHNSVPNNTLPIFWSNGRVNEKGWKPLFPRV